MTMPVSNALKGMDREEKLEYLLDTAFRCLARYGFSGTTMERIAEEAGVSKGTLTYYFKNKEDITCRVASHVSAKFHGEVRQALEGLKDPRERLIRAIELFWTGYIGRPELITGYYDMWSQSFFHPALKEEVVAIYTDFRRIFLDELIRVSAKAGPDGERLLSDAILIAGVVDGVATQFFLEPELTDWDRVLGRLRDIVSTMLDSP
jgi:TetR/AcrR family transcriptional repressor of bet genes